MVEVSFPPFCPQQDLTSNDVAKTSLYDLSNVSSSHLDWPLYATITNILDKEFATPVLDELYPRLWLVAKKSSAHIDSLHAQRVKRRELVLVEDPKLHLIWYNDIVYLKPIPRYLLNHDFWWQTITHHGSKSRPQILVDTNDLSPEIKHAIGFLRSYTYLIKHESDFLIAQDAYLLPRDIMWTDFMRFIQCFRTIPDEAVSQRYHFGQLRLTRLNYAVRLFRPRATGKMFPLNYHERFWQTSQYVGRFGPFLLFLFAILSTTLSAMQVVLAALGTDTWAAFVKASLGFSIAVLILELLFLAIFTLGICGLLVFQGQFALRMRFRDNI